MIAPDLTIAIGTMATLSLVAGSLTATIFYSNKGQRTILCLAVATLATIYFLFYGSGQLFWAHWISDSAAIIYTNLAAIFAAMAAGWSWRLPKTPRWRRGMLCVLLSCASFAMVLWPLLSIVVRPPPAGGNDWNNGVAMQTSWATCSPAAAATFLRANNIDVNEADMIPLCLTDSSGTPTLGLYRGIKLVAETAARDVDVVSETLDQMIRRDEWPVLLAVELPYGTDDPRYVEQWGWVPGMGHSVVALATLPNGRGLLIGDPSIGLERWTLDDLRVLWHGDGIRMKGSSQ